MTCQEIIRCYTISAHHEQSTLANIKQAINTANSNLHNNYVNSAINFYALGNANDIRCQSYVDTKTLSGIQDNLSCMQTNEWANLLDAGESRAAEILSIHSSLGNSYANTPLMGLLNTLVVEIHDNFADTPLTGLPSTVDVEINFT
jgi:hypothetical protein